MSKDAHERAWRANVSALRSNPREGVASHFFRNAVAAFVVALFVSSAIIAVSSAAVDADGDFTIAVLIEGQDITTTSRIVLDPTRETIADVQILNVRSEVVLTGLSVSVVFLGREVGTFEESLGGKRLRVGESFKTQVRFDASAYLVQSGVTLATGVFDVRVRLIYDVAGVAQAFLMPVEVKVGGNALATPTGAVAVAAGAASLAAGLSLLRAAATPGIAVGSSLASGARALPLDQLRDLAAGRLEPMARGKVVGAVTKATHERISKDICPLDEGSLRHGICVTCGRSSAERRTAYAETMNELVVRAAGLFAEGGAVTVARVSEILGISPKTATDLVAVAGHAKLVKVQGVAAKLARKAIFMGVNSAISLLLLAGFGGFVKLTPTLLIAIIVVAMVVPIVLTRFLAWRTKRQVRGGA